MKELSEMKDEKIANFLAMTNTDNVEIALKYLNNTNWDESQAVSLYMAELQRRGNITINNINNNDINNDNDMSDHLLFEDRNGNNNNNTNNGNNDGFFNRWIISPLYGIFSIFSDCSESNGVKENEISKNLRKIFPNYFSKYNIFLERTGAKNIGLIILYVERDYEYMINILQNANNFNETKEIMKKMYVFSTMVNSKEGDNIINSIGGYNLSMPIFLFYYNQNNSKKFLNSNVYKIIDGKQINAQNFRKALTIVENELKPIIISSVNMESTSDIINQQNENMNKLEEEYKKKQLQSKNQASLEKAKLSEIELRLKEVQEKAKKAKNILNDEPNESEEGVTVICFRFPDGEKRMERRFKKTNKVKDLYTYVDSLGECIYNEGEYKGYGLYQPFPPKKYENLDNTLEKEGLYPNAVIQIKEN